MLLPPHGERPRGDPRAETHGVVGPTQASHGPVLRAPHHGPGALHPALLIRRERSRRDAELGRDPNPRKPRRLRPVLERHQRAHPRRLRLAEGLPRSEPPDQLLVPGGDLRPDLAHDGDDAGVATAGRHHGREVLGAAYLLAHPLDPLLLDHLRGALAGGAPLLHGLPLAGHVPGLPALDRPPALLVGGRARAGGSPLSAGAPLRLGLHRWSQPSWGGLRRPGPPFGVAPGVAAVAPVAPVSRGGGGARRVRVPGGRSPCSPGPPVRATPAPLLRPGPEGGGDRARQFSVTPAVALPILRAVPAPGVGG